MTIEQIISMGYKEHHTALRRGYESRIGTGHPEKYSGRFGKGFIWVTPLKYTTRYVAITYFVK